MTTKEFTDLSKKFEKVIKSSINSHSYRCKQYGISREDLTQTALITLWEASQKMSPTNEGFEKYASSAIRKRIAREVMDYATSIPHETRRRNGLDFYPQAHSSFHSEDMNILSYEDDYSGIFVDDFIKTIPKPYRKIIRLLISGIGKDEIVEKHEISRRIYEKATEEIPRLYKEYERRCSE